MPSSGISRSLLSVLAALVEVKSGDVPNLRLTGFSCPQLRRRSSMRAKILATLREWNILIGFCFVLGGVIFIAWILSMPPEIGDGRADLSRFSAAGIPSCFQGCRAGGARAHPLRGHRWTRRGQANPRRRRSRRHTRCPATAKLNHRAPPPPPSIRRTLRRHSPLLPRRRPRQRHTRCWPTTSATIERPRRRCGERPSGATRYSNTPDTGQRDGCRRRCGSRPSSLQKMPGLPFAGARQELARPEPLGHLRQKVG